MPLFGKLLQHAGGGGPCAAGGFFTARQAHFTKQNIAQLLRGAGVEGLADNALNVSLKARHALRKFTRQAREDLPVDRDAAPLHARQHVDQRALQRLVDGAHAFSRKARFEHAPQAQSDVGIFG